MRKKERSKIISPRRLGTGPASFVRYGALLLSLALSSCAGSSPSSASNQKEEESSSQTQTAIGAKALADNVRNSFASGFTLSLNEAVLTAGEKNVFDLAGGSLSFSLKGLSLHDLSFSLSAPVSYNGLGQRKIEASLVDDQLYFALSCPQEKQDPYEVRYQVSTAAYTYEEGGESHDSITGGIFQYEFGRLDWIIDDILQILSSYAFSPSPKTSVEKTSFDWGAISSSLDEIREISAGSGYFLWKLPIGEHIYSIGLKSDESYSLSGIDFPAKGVEGASGDLPGGFSLTLSADFLSGGTSILPPEGKDSYLELDNSIDLWERIATYAGKSAFSLSSFHEEDGVRKNGLVLTHKEEEVPDTDVAIGHPAIDEKAVFEVSGQADFQGGRINDLSALASFQGEKESKYIQARFLDGNPDQQIYMDVNGIFKAKTSKTTADALWSAFANLLGDPSISNKYLTTLLSAANSISSAIDSIKESQVGKDIVEGHYEHILDTITKLECRDNRIYANLDLTKAGSSGSLELTLSGTDLALAEITFKGFTIGYFGIEGTLQVSDYVSSSGDFDPTSYAEMDHLPSLSDQLEDLFQSHSLEAKFKGYLLDKGTTAVSEDTRFASLGGKSPLTEEGFAFEGRFAFNLEEKTAMGQGVFLDRKKDYLNEHAISIQIDGDEDSNGNMLFGYSSKNDKKNSGADGYKDLNYGNITEPSSDPMYGRFTISSLNSLLNCLGGLLNSSDSRFTRFTDAKDTIATTLIAKLAQGQIAPLLTEKILLSATKTGDVLDVVVSKSLLGSASDVSLRIVFGESGLSLLRVQVDLGEKELFLQLETAVPKSPFSKEDLAVADLKNNESKAVDYSSLPTLVDYALGSATLGEDENGQSTYHLSGKANIKALSSLFSLDVNFSFFVALTGAEVKIIGVISVPMVIGVNTKELFGGTRYVEMYYHTSGNDQDGTFFFHRVHDNAISDDTEDYAKVKASDFSANLLNWLCGYVLGLSSTIMDKITSSSAEEETPSSLHGEEFVTSYVYQSQDQGAQWDLALNLSSLTSVLYGPIKASIQGKEITANGAKAKTLTSLSASLGIVKGLFGKAVFDLSLNASLANVSTGVYVPVWTPGSPSSDDELTFHGLSSKKHQSKTVHAADAYTSTFYNQGYATSGVFASAKYYTTSYTG